MKKFLAVTFCALSVSACSTEYAGGIFHPTFSKPQVEKQEAMRAYAKWYREHYQGGQQEQRRGVMMPPPAQKIKLPVKSSSI